MLSTTLPFAAKPLFLRSDLRNRHSMVSKFVAATPKKYVPSGICHKSTHLGTPDPKVSKFVQIDHVAAIDRPARFR